MCHCVDLHAIGSLMRTVVSVKSYFMCNNFFNPIFNNCMAYDTCVCVCVCVSDT